MKIEAGKYYVTRGGDVVGPMVYVSDGSLFPWRKDPEDSKWRGYTDSGRYTGSYCDYHLDLIKEHVMPKFKVGDFVKSGAWEGKVTYVKEYVEFVASNGLIVRRDSDLVELISSLPPSPSLDLTKPVQTRDGRKVRVLCTDGPGSRPVIGIIDGNKGPSTWCLNGATSEGWFNPDLESESALINTPATPRTFERWFNVYDTREITSHVDRHDADGEIPWQNRIARKRVVFTEGEWDE